MFIDSLSRKPLKIKKNKHSVKWLAAVFVLVFCLTSAGFVNLGLAQEEAGEPNASSTPEVLLPIESPADNASSTPVAEQPLETPALDNNASSTPETINSDSLTNASSTEANASSTAPVPDSLIPNVSSTVPNDVATGMDLSFGGNERPVVQAIWEMNQATSSSDQGKDDSLADGAQFMPSGQYQVDKKIEVCAVVSDPDGLADLKSVSSQIYYPENIYLGPNRLSSQPGCGQPKEEWFWMAAVESSQGIELFCQQLRNQNTNLASFKTGYDFESLCGPSGDLIKETSKVFCGQTSLSYQDPAGEYRVKTAGLDQKNEAGVLENNFKYLELVAFEIDFDNIDYGSIRLNSAKVLAGNDVFLANDGRPTIRNIGNTRLEIAIKQNDMGLGQSEKGWNLTYQARVGQETSFTNYWPEAWTTLANSMNLGQTSPLDLSIEVLKFPESVLGEHYAGKLSLNAVAAPQLMCAE